MNLTTVLYKKEDFEFLELALFDNYLVASKWFSSVGMMDMASAIEAFEKIRLAGKKGILLLDILLSEDDFNTQIDRIRDFIHANDIKTVRVQDIGIFEFILDEFKDIEIELSLKAGHHNFVSIKNWVNYGKGRVSKVILSTELPRETIKKYAKEIPVPVEVYAFGSILIFHSPRHLLKKEMDEYSRNGEIWASGKSEESPHQGFRILDNDRGTFMFHPKKLSILEYKDELQGMGVGALFVDLYPKINPQTVKVLSEFLEDTKPESLTKLKECYNEKFIRGFYLGNKTDALFSKLRVPTAHRDDPNFLGEVLESHKNRFIAVKINSKVRKVNVGDEILFLTPEGKKQTQRIRDMRNILLEPIDVGAKDDIIYLRYSRGVVPRTNVFLVGGDHHGI